MDRRRLRGAGPLDRIGRDLDRLEGECRVEIEPVTRLLLEAGGDLLGALVLRVVPGHARHIAVAVFSQCVGECFLVGARTARADDAHRRPVLFHHFADDENRIAHTRDRHQQVGADDLRLGNLDRKVARAHVVGNSVENLDRNLQLFPEGINAFHDALSEGVVDMENDGGLRLDARRRADFLDARHRICDQGGRRA